MPDFSKRSREIEMMDDFGLGPEIIHPIMDELEVINKLLGGYAVFFNAFKKLNLTDGMSVSDWGCGGGDSLRQIAKWARKHDIELELVGIDATDSAISYAEKKAIAYPEINFIKADVLSKQLKSGQFDIIISSLFTHHFENESWIKLIKKMSDCARKAVIVNDLHRHWFAYHSIGVLTRLFSRSPMVKHDSKVSVLRGFKKRELIDLLVKAGIKKYAIKWMWAFRWQLIIYKD
ncbi:methyltransferase domain-containing protein [Rubrolithibacter danxiaensis]|uniref:methyltransferase domain-containing protein n=1 Tax=Rubrolithibacter danxiaensis TaxID=3390805 RepID=UPI003BF859F1